MAFSLKRGVLAAGTAATVFLGVTYGAGLKTQKELSQDRSKLRAMTADDQIAVLEVQRAELGKQHAMLERKLELFEETVREREAKKTKGTADVAR